MATQPTAEAGLGVYSTLSENITNFRYVVVAANGIPYGLVPVSLFTNGFNPCVVYQNKVGDRLGCFAEYHSSTQARIYGYVTGNYTFSGAQLYGIK